MRLAPLLVGGVLILAGCHPVGPDYKLPDEAVVNAPTASGAFVGSKEKSVTIAEAPDKWWTLYRDPRLNGLVEQALKANTELRVAGANILRAEAALAGTEDAKLPQTKIDAQFGYEQLSGEQYLLDVPLPPMGLYDTGVTIGYQIDLFGQIRRAIEASRADEQVAHAAYDAARITVAAETVRAYVDACAAGHELEVARHSLDLQRQSRDLTGRLVHAGRGNALDLTRSQGQLEQFRANIPQLEAQHRVALYRLAVMIGKPPAEYPKSLDNCAREPTLTSLIPVGDGAALLRRRPDIRQAERQLAAATARIGVATADLYPKISFALTGGSTGAIDDIFTEPTERFGIGPLISWNFPQQDGVRARIKGAEASAQAALATFDGKVLTSLREVESALTVYGRDLDRLAALRAARDRSAEATAQADSLYKAGRQDALNNLDAHRTLAGADQALAQAESKVAADQVALFLALGGGWQVDAPAGVKQAKISP
ncbi:MAG TPA: TolC family protein [Alphaproteobacteria bacterium]|nr:TolC family protein [Alphaproteobacteria bacterium]